MSSITSSILFAFVMQAQAAVPPRVSPVVQQKLPTQMVKPDAAMARRDALGMLAAAGAAVLPFSSAKADEDAMYQYVPVVAGGTQTGVKSFASRKIDRSKLAKDYKPGIDGYAKEEKPERLFGRFGVEAPEAPEGRYEAYAPKYSMQVRPNAFGVKYDRPSEDSIRQAAGKGIKLATEDLDPMNLALVGLIGFLVGNVVTFVLYRRFRVVLPATRQPLLATSA